jgi:mannose-1-phosphate guanylyltransferase
MRHAVILAGGTGTRLWPMSRNALPKQLIPFIGGRSLLSLSFHRLDGLVGEQERWVCAGETLRPAILAELPGLSAGRFLGEPTGRDTLNALAYSAAVIARVDRDATMGVFTADHLITPVEAFRDIVSRGYEAAEGAGAVLVTFGITPTEAATGYGYLRLGPALGPSARIVAEFKEKPDKATAARWVAEGPERFLWNGGMFVWKASVFLDCVRRYAPATFEGVTAIAAAWDTPRFAGVLREVYPSLEKISVDFAVMEKASKDPAVRVAAVPMDLSWRDIGSWPSFAETCPKDEKGNAVAAERCLLVDTTGTLAASSDPGHLVAALGCDDLLIVHTPTATLVCRRDRAEDVKKLQALAAGKFGGDYV